MNNKKNYIKINGTQHRSLLNPNIKEINDIKSISIIKKLYNSYKFENKFILE